MCVFLELFNLYKWVCAQNRTFTEIHIDVWFDVGAFGLVLKKPFPAIGDSRDDTRQNTANYDDNIWGQPIHTLLKYRGSFMVWWWW